MWVKAAKAGLLLLGTLGSLGSLNSFQGERVARLMSYLLSSPEGQAPPEAGYSPQKAKAVAKTWIASEQTQDKTQIDWEKVGTIKKGVLSGDGHLTKNAPALLVAAGYSPQKAKEVAKAWIASEQTKDKTQIDWERVGTIKKGILSGDGHLTKNAPELLLAAGYSPQKAKEVAKAWIALDQTKDKTQIDWERVGAIKKGVLSGDGHVTKNAPELLVAAGYSPQKAKEVAKTWVASEQTKGKTQIDWEKVSTIKKGVLSGDGHVTKNALELLVAAGYSPQKAKEVAKIWVASEQMKDKTQIDWEKVSTIKKGVLLGDGRVTENVPDLLVAAGFSPQKAKEAATKFMEHPIKGDTMSKDVHGAGHGDAAPLVV